MNDSNDASSMAAHGARPEASKGDDPAEDQNDTQSGFFRRFFGALGADEDHNGEEDDLGGDGGETVRAVGFHAVHHGGLGTSGE